MILVKSGLQLTSCHALTRLCHVLFFHFLCNVLHLVFFMRSVLQLSLRLQARCRPRLGINSCLAHLHGFDVSLLFPFDLILDELALLCQDILAARPRKCAPPMGPLRLRLGR